MKPTKCYAVTSGEYSDYQVHAIYRRREDADKRAENNNYIQYWMVGVGKRNPAREVYDDMRVEEFDYYEGEALPASVETRRRKS